MLVLQSKLARKTYRKIAIWLNTYLTTHHCNSGPHPKTRWPRPKDSNWRSCGQSWPRWSRFAKSRRPIQSRLFRFDQMSILNDLQRRKRGGVKECQICGERRKKIFLLIWTMGRFINYMDFWVVNRSFFYKCCQNVMLWNRVHLT